MRLPLEGTFSPAGLLLQPDGLVVVGGFRERKSQAGDQEVLIFKVK